MNLWSFYVHFGRMMHPGCLSLGPDFSFYNILICGRFIHACIQVIMWYTAFTILLYFPCYIKSQIKIWCNLFYELPERSWTKHQILVEKHAPLVSELLNFGNDQGSSAFFFFPPHAFVMWKIPQSFFCFWKETMLFWVLLVGSEKIRKRRKGTVWSGFHYVCFLIGGVHSKSISAFSFKL